ncbi:hypothetical protein OSTOST_09033 [Ostertagia ostertagi]
MGNNHGSLPEIEQLTEKLDRMEEDMAQMAATIQRMTTQGPQVEPVAKPKQYERKQYHKEEPANPRKNAPDQDQDGTVYAYVSESEQDSTEARNQPINQRRDQAKIDFIKECFFKHYKVPEAFRKQMWNDRVQCLNNRAYHTRKAEEKKAEEESRYWV